MRQVLGRAARGKLSPIRYGLGFGLAFVAPLLSYAAIAVAWLVPDRRVVACLRATRLKSDLV